MASITKRVRDIVRERLQSSNGLNAQLATYFADHALADPPVVNWDIEARQFFEANISFDDLVESDSPSTPCVFLYSTGAQNQNRVKFRNFAGQVTMRVDVVIENEATRAPETMENYADLVEEALICCLNAHSWAEVQSGGVAYNGQIETERTAAVTVNSSNWRQVVSAILTFEVTV